MTTTAQECLANHTQILYRPGHPHGFVIAVNLAEVALCRVLWDPTEVAEVRLPGFTFPCRPGKVAVSIRIVQGMFKLGPVQLCAPDGRVIPVTLLGFSFTHPAVSQPGAREAWIAWMRGALPEVTLDGVTTTPCGVALDPADSLYIAEAGNNLVREVVPGPGALLLDSTSAVTTLAGTGTAGVADGVGSAGRAQMDRRFGVATSFVYRGSNLPPGGNIYILIVRHPYVDVRAHHCRPCVGCDARTNANQVDPPAGSAPWALLGAIVGASMGLLASVAQVIMVQSGLVCCGVCLSPPPPCTEVAVSGRLDPGVRLGIIATAS